AAGGGEDDVEGGLLLRRGAVAGCGSATRGRHGDRRRGRDAPLVLDLLLQLDQLEHRHAPELLEDGVNCRHWSSPPRWPHRLRRSGWWCRCRFLRSRAPRPLPLAAAGALPPEPLARLLLLPRRRAARCGRRSARTGSAAVRSRAPAAG